ncbi:MAG: serine/threonine protein kinase [Deltaproteobacteria bacterium]|nr:serine/threonine protein kinase [Deltaproteobacteria bacterium]
MPEPEEHQFGQYQLVEKIAQGGMAEIFRGRARDFEGIEKPVVIKRILPQIAASPEFVEMLIDEAKIAVMLSHGNIAQIYDLGKVADDYFIVMEYVDGKTLSHIMKRLRNLNRRMPVAYALWLCAEIANGLDYMHRKTDDQGNPLHIVHRDISPQNIILSTSGTVKIIDFGIAKAKTKVSTTDSGILKGKFAYMSPEHAEGGKLDHRTDIFSLGVILFELLTGERLFKGKNNRETISRVKKAKVPLPSQLRDKVTKELDRLVLKALAKDREKRYQTALEFHGDLTRYLVTQYPEFSPRELVKYLAQIFPELAQKMSETPIPHTPTATEKEEESLSEPTAAASSNVIRKNLAMDEIYEVPSVSPPESSEEKVSFYKLILPRLQKIARIGAIGLGVIALALIGIEAAPWISRQIKTASSYLTSLSETIQPPIEKEIAEKPLPPKLPSVVEPPPNGFLKIESEPPGAIVFLNDKKTEWITPAKVELPPRDHQKIGLHLEKYRFWESTFDIKSKETTELAAKLEINFGDLEIDSLPPKAAVYLNGKRVGQTPFERRRLPPETTFEVVLQLEGYEEWRRDVKIFGGKREIVKASLQKTKKSRALR